MKLRCKDCVDSMLNNINHNRSHVNSCQKEYQSPVVVSKNMDTIFKEVYQGQPLETSTSTGAVSDARFDSYGNEECFKLFSSDEDIDSGNSSNSESDTV